MYILNTNKSESIKQTRKNRSFRQQNNNIKAQVYGKYRGLQVLNTSGGTDIFVGNGESRKKSKILFTISKCWKCDQNQVT